MKNDFLPSAPLTINWAITNRCNFRCRHCYSRNDPSDEIDQPTMKRCIEHVTAAGVLSINFGGGEPLMRKDILDISRFAGECGLRVSMNSNGYLIDEETAAALKQSGIKKVGISIDSHDPDIHDAFRGVRGCHERARRALLYLQHEGIETSISTVICRINHSDVDALVHFASSSGVKQLNFHNFKCSGLGYVNRDRLDLTSGEWKAFYIMALKAREAADDLEVSLEDPIIASLDGDRKAAMVKGSICGKLSLNIKSNGDISPCGFIPVVIGNITADDLGAIWSDSPVLERMRHKVPKGKCVSCRHYGDCLGGCTARAIALTGDMNNPDPHCWHNEIRTDK